MHNPYIYRILEIEKIVDGDTIDFIVDLGFGLSYGRGKHLRVRLLGINTPEVRGTEKEAGLAAKQFVVDWFTRHEGRPLFLKTVKDKTGKYGRYLGEILAQEPEGAIPEFHNLNRDLLATGHAVPYRS